MFNALFKHHKMLMFYYHRDLLIHPDDAFKDSIKDGLSSQDSGSDLDIIDIERELRNFKTDKRLTQVDKRILNAVVNRPKSVKARLNELYLDNSDLFSSSLSIPMRQDHAKDGGIEEELSSLSEQSDSEEENESVYEER